MTKKIVLHQSTAWLKHRLSSWNTGGEGVNSPYLFEWVRMVMSDKNTYYRWADIEQCRHELLKCRVEIECASDCSLGAECCMRHRCQVRDVAKRSLQEKPYSQMLFRLVNWLGHDLRTGSKGLSLIEIGSGVGLTTAYLAGVDTRDVVLSCDGCEAMVKIARENLEKLGLMNVVCHEGMMPKAMLDEISEIDIAVVDLVRTSFTMDYFDSVTQKIHEKSVLVLNNIHYDTASEDLWKQICQDKRVTTTMDLYQMGLVFFDKHYWKRNYIMRL
jgi:precorrin-6B methylase 2